MSEDEKHDLLIVDDEVHICKLVERWATQAGYTHKSAYGGQEAIDLLGKYGFSVVISDIMMPGVSGIDVLDFISENFAYTPVILMTGLDDNRFIKRAYALGCYGYMSKPLSQNELLSNIINALRRKELEEDHIMRVGSLESKIKERTQEIEGALESISEKMQQVLVEKDFETRFENDQIPECSIEMNCQKEDCPCYGKGQIRCWQIAGTFCGGATQGKFIEKYHKCSECPVFKKAGAGYRLQIGEHFNNMMALLSQKHQNLRNAYENLQNSQQQIVQQEKMASIGQLSAGIAHEINNPVGYVSSNLTSLQKYFKRLKEFIALQAEVITAYEQGIEPININVERRRLKIDYILEDIEDVTKESQDGCERVRSIVRDLKSFARSDEDKPEIADLHEVIDTTINVIWNEIKYKAKVEKKYGELPKINCFASKLSQVFMNLIVNASHAIEKEGIITITTWAADNSVFVAIHDNGSGVPPENLKKIFSAFFTTKAKGKGTGLGLSICKEIIEKHNGNITVESVVGEGTTFTIQLKVDETLPTE